MYPAPVRQEEPYWAVHEGLSCEAVVSMNEQEVIKYEINQV